MIKHLPKLSSLPNSTEFLCSKQMWLRVIPRPANCFLLPLHHTSFCFCLQCPSPHLHSLLPLVTPTCSFMHHLLDNSSLILKSLDAHSRWFHNIHGLSPIKALVTLNHSNELTPLLPVLDYELSEGKNCGCFFFFFFNLCISSAWHSTCLKVDIQYMFVPCLGILFLLSNIWASYFVHRHILSEQRGRERSRRYQKQKKETVRRTIYGSLWLTSGSHSLGLLKFIKPCKSKQKVSI